VSTAIDLEARRTAQEAKAEATTALKRADQAVNIARSANDTSSALARAVDRGFSMIEGKVDALIEDLRQAKTGGSMRPKLDSVSEEQTKLAKALEDTRAALEQRTKALEAAEEARAKAKAEQLAAQAEAKRVEVNAAEARRKAVRRLAWACAIGFATTVGGGVAAWTLNEARHVAAEHHQAR
jgi:chromosome segregation ATPase